LEWLIQRIGRSGAGGFQHRDMTPDRIGAGRVDAFHPDRNRTDSGRADRAGVNSEAMEARRTAMWGRRKSGGKTPHSIGEDGLGLSKTIIAQRLILVNGNLLVIRMDVAI